jgi:preprotein translocase subunit SecY
MNLLKSFARDLNIAVKNDISNKTTLKQISMFLGLILTYTYAIPISHYYRDRQKRIEKINKLKDEGKYVL